MISASPVFISRLVSRGPLLVPSRAACMVTRHHYNAHFQICIKGTVSCMTHDACKFGRRLPPNMHVAYGNAPRLHVCRCSAVCIAKTPLSLQRAAQAPRRVQKNRRWNQPYMVKLAGIEIQGGRRGPRLVGAVPTGLLAQVDAVERAGLGVRLRHRGARRRVDQRLQLFVARVDQALLKSSSGLLAGWSFAIHA